MPTPTSFSRSKPELIGRGSRGASVADVRFASTNLGGAISPLGRQRAKVAPASGRSMDAAGGRAFKRPQPTCWRPVFGAPGGTNDRNALGVDVARARRADLGQPSGERQSGYRNCKSGGLLPLQSGCGWGGEEARSRDSYSCRHSFAFGSKACYRPLLWLPLKDPSPCFLSTTGTLLALQGAPVSVAPMTFPEKTQRCSRARHAHRSPQTGRSTRGVECGEHSTPPGT